MLPLYRYVRGTEKFSDLTKFTNPVSNRAGQCRALCPQSSHCKQCAVLTEAELDRYEKCQGSKPVFTQQLHRHTPRIPTQSLWAKSGHFHRCVLPPSAPMREVQQKQAALKGNLPSLIMEPIHHPQSPEAPNGCVSASQQSSVCTVVMCLTASRWPSNPTGPT